MGFLLWEVWEVLLLFTVISKNLFFFFNLIPLRRNLIVMLHVPRVGKQFPLFLFDGFLELLCELHER